MYLRQLFRILFRTLNHQYDYTFDWTMLKQKAAAAAINLNPNNTNNNSNNNNGSGGGGVAASATPGGAIGAAGGLSASMGNVNADSGILPKPNGTSGKIFCEPKLFQIKFHPIPKSLFFSSSFSHLSQKSFKNKKERRLFLFYTKSKL